MREDPLVLPKLWVCKVLDRKIRYAAVVDLA